MIRLAKNRALSSRQLNPQIISRDPSNNTILSEGLVPSRSTMSPQSSPAVDVIQLRYVTCLAFLFYSYLIYSHSFFYLLGNITVSNFPHFSQMRTSFVQNCQTGQIGLCISKHLQPSLIIYIKSCDLVCIVSMVQKHYNLYFLICKLRFCHGETW